MLPPAKSELKITVSEIEHSLTKKVLLLGSKNAEYERLVESRAQKKRDWKIAYRMAVLEHKGQSVTLIKDMVNGDKQVSKLEMEYEISLGVEKACLQSMLDLREQIGLLRSFLSWHKSERFMQGS